MVLLCLIAELSRRGRANQSGRILNPRRKKACQLEQTSPYRLGCRNRQGFFGERCPPSLSAPQRLTPFATQWTFTNLPLPRSFVEVHWHVLFYLSSAFPGQG